jgi:hypothetical protein
MHPDGVDRDYTQLRAALHRLPLNPALPADGWIDQVQEA